MTQEQRDDACYEAISIVNELHKTIDYSVYCRLMDLIDMLGLPAETCTVEQAKDARSEPVSPTTQLDAKHSKNLISGALAGTDYADRLRWLLSQAERVVTVDAEDRQAVERACQLLKQIDNGFDAVRE